MTSQSMVLEILLLTKDVNLADGFFSTSKHARDPRVVFNKLLV